MEQQATAKVTNKMSGTREINAHINRATKIL